VAVVARINELVAHQELQKLSQEIQNIADKIEQKTLRWLELDEIM